ncbi:CAP domain-containing protein [Streptomyces sp. ZAF1911]|uniref:CAP domain-containing protein n=1 Tax=Streptomyces sp. ZAF1911 TaxID=2944129 RepID=UPI00237BFF8B|nr:CAP domain-containing protein [Streptomyces sp. ZAF1911]MDD9375621.1 CAP domain-containing protein [Streptomyces sp. ZAF1911]
MRIRISRPTAVVSFAVAVALSVPVFPAAGPAVAAPASATPVDCTAMGPDADDIAPSTNPGRFGFGTMFQTLATVCLINDERRRLGLEELPLDSELTSAARTHLNNSLAQQWWGRGRNPHQNPQVAGSGDEQIGRRIKDAGYCANGGAWTGREIVYNGWGGSGTPKAAVNWWLNISTQGHAEIIRDPSLTDIGAAARGGAADRAGADQSQAGTYVVTFGSCES